MVVVSMVAAVVFTVAAVFTVVAVSMPEDFMVAVSTESVVEALSWHPVGDGATDFTEVPW